MAARVRLLCGPPRTGKTAYLLEQFRARSHSQPGSALWLGPTARSVEAIALEVMGMEPALVGARFLSFAGFFEEVVRTNEPSQRTLGPVQQRLLAEEIAARLADRGRLPYFARVVETRGFSEGMLTLLADLKRQDVSPTQLARAALRRGKGEKSRPSTAKDRAVARLYARYEQALDQLRLVDGEGNPSRGLQLLKRGLWRPFNAVRVVILDGFVDFTVSQHRTLEMLAARCDEIWISLADETGDLRAELWERSRQTRTRCQQTLAAEVQWSTSAATTSGPRGLSHLRQQLFRSPRQVETASQAQGVELIEAPGALGEARMIARRIKTLLLEGVSPRQIVTTARDVAAHADLFEEVFAEYGIPLEVEGTQALTHCPPVAFLLRAVRLAEEDWPFAAVTAVLRSGYFHPDWPELLGQPQRPQQAEALLRLLGEPRDKNNYLRAVRRWAKEQQPGLEDEQAEESRRRRTHELAGACLPFLERFFHAWDHLPAAAPLTQHLEAFAVLAEQLGVATVAQATERDRQALARFWEEFRAWQQRAGSVRLSRKTFQRRLGAVAAAAGIPRSSRTFGCVRLLSAESARHLAMDHLFVMGLGERSFPRPVPTQALFDERERQDYKRAGIDMPGGGDQLGEEMLLFYQLITRTRHSLTLSYAAVDERGQALLPSSFLISVLDCFQTDAVARERRQMQIQGYLSDCPLSMAEYRIRVVAGGSDHLAGSTGLSETLRANLLEAKRLQQKRFHAQHNVYDGMLRDPRVVAEVAAQFQPERILSPTALEEYITCPFRFFLRNVLRLELLEDPREEIEVTRRGQAFHRALARLHRRLKENGVNQPSPTLEAEVVHEITTAVEEDINRAPSPAARMLWQLEGQRLLRPAGRYGLHWQQFLTPWQERGITPRPHLFEIDFGLPATEGQEGTPFGPLVLSMGDEVVRISGRIDRIDLADLPDGSVGFWIIDYKTGRGTNYTGSDLSRFRRLQLPLYALAVEQVLLNEKRARPLGLAYWLVAEDGPKLVMPGPRKQLPLWWEDEKRWHVVRQILAEWVTTLVGQIRAGRFPLQPRDEDCTSTCHYGQICRITSARTIAKEWSLPLPVIEA